MRAANTTAVIATCVWLLSCGRQAPENADIILTNGRIFTGASAGFVEALSVRGETIQATGTTQEITARAAAATRRIDLGGRLVIPGINDAHVHMDPVLPDVAELKFESMDPSCGHVLAQLKAETGKSPQSTPILADVGPSAFFDAQCTPETLDGLAPRHAVVLRTWSGHASILNHAAISRFQVPVSNPPPGGFYGKTMRAQKLDGVVQEYARYQLDLLMGRAASDELLLKRLAAFLEEAARYGITSLQTMSPEPDRLLRLLKQLGTPVRIRVISFPMQQGMSEVAAGASRQVTPNLIHSGLKYILDGTPIERSMAIRKPYQDAPSWSGQLNFPEELIGRTIKSAARSDNQLLLHVVGDRSVEVVLQAMEAVGAPLDWPGQRLRLEHADGLMPDLMPRAKSLGVVVVQNPSHLMVGDLTVRRLGQERASHVMPFRSLVEAGIPFALGSDGLLNPFLNILFATTNPNNPKEALTREQAIAAYTKWSAYAEFAENAKGTLEPGKQADLAVLSQNLFDVAPPELPKTESVLTMIGGKIVRQKF